MMNWTWFNPDFNKPLPEWQQLFETWRAAGIDAIIPNVFNAHRAHYASTHFPVSQPWLDQILPLAKAADLQVHGWMWAMPCNIEGVLEQHPEWYVVNRKGESAHAKPAYVPYYKFLCPNQPGVAEHVQTVVTELAQYELLDGVHLDYIRFPDVILPDKLQPKYHIVQDREYPEFDYCYCDVCRSKFEAQTGIDPLKLENPAEHAAWIQFRRDSITQLVNGFLIPAARKYGKKVTAAVFPNWQNVRQEWSKWQLDAALPMLYHNFYDGTFDWLRRETARGVQSLPPEIPLYSGIFIPALKPAELVQAIEVSREAGAQGVSMFEAFSMTDAHWKSLRSTRR